MQFGCQAKTAFEFRNADVALDLLSWLTQLQLHCAYACVRSRVVFFRVYKCEVGGQEKPK